MNSPLYLALVLLIGLIGGKIASKFKLPSVTGYIIFGLLIGPSFLNIITKDMIKQFSFINHLALGILAFSIGTELHRAVFKKLGKTLFLVSLGDISLTFILVSVGTYILGIDIGLAIILGILAMTVSPSGVYAIVKEYGAKGAFTKNLLALVAMDNLVCIVLFGLATAILQGIGNLDFSGIDLVIMIAKEIGFAILIGIFTGITLSLVIWKKQNNNRFLVFLLGIILLNSGLAIELQLSALLINIVSGAVVTNMINRKFVISSTLERIELPIFVLFLTLAGAKLDVHLVSTIGIIGVVYIAGRLFGKVIGTYFASGFTSLPTTFRKNIGMALTPQAGVAIGLSIIAEQKLTYSNGMITGIVLCGVIFFEIFGPLLLKRALKNAKEI